ncbi:MAG: exonuclease domain-containing protein [bacterium]
MRQTTHRALKQEGKPVSYLALARKILKDDGLSEETAKAILDPLLESNPHFSKDDKGRWRAVDTVLKGRFLPDTTFCVVDIETTGGRPPQHRVTELAAVKIKNGKVLGEYHRLVNPGREIPWSVVRLTGITDAMVLDQPELTELLPSFLDFIDGTVFVAHCANFDFHFVRYFASEYLGREIAPPVLCTFKLGQRLLPQAGRYNLGELAAFVGIDDSANDRHRALGDAKTTADIFMRFLRMLQMIGLESLQDVLDYQDVTSKEAPSLAEGISIDPATLNDLPPERGVFRLLNEKSETVYSGKATDIQRAVRDIFYPKNRSAAKFVHKLKSVRRVEARPLESELGMSIQALRLRRGSKGMNGAAQAGGNGFLKISLASKYPRAYSVNHLAVDGGAYYGPFRKQAQLRDLIGAIHALFPLRNAQRPGKNPGAPDVAEETNPEISIALYEKLINRLQRMLEGRMRRSSEETLLRLLEEAWGSKGPSPGQLKRNLGRLRHLVQNHSLSGPSVERRNLLIIEPGESMKRRVCYFVRCGLLVDEVEFDRSEPPIDELAARMQAVFFGEETQAKEPEKEALEEAAIIAAWLRRELIDGFVIELSSGPDLEEVLETLLRALADPRAAGTSIPA